MAAEAPGTGPTITGLTLAGGRFSARVTTGAAASGEVPRVDLVVGGEAMAEALLTPAGAEGFALSAPLPAAAQGDGVQTVVFRERASGSVLGRYVLRAGAALDGDVLNDLAALDGEIAALKRAFMAEAADRKLRAAERPLIVAEAVEAALRALADAEEASWPETERDGPTAPLGATRSPRPGSV